MSERQTQVPDPMRGGVARAAAERPLRATIGLAFAALYVALDLLYEPFLAWPGVAVWYPPAGLAFAVLVGFGLRYLPFHLAATLAGAFLLNPAPLPALDRLLVALAIPAGYGAGAALLRHRAKIDVRLASLHAAVWFCAVALIVPFAVGAFVVWRLAAADAVAPGAFLPALLDFWIGDAIAILTLSPALLVLVLPWLNPEVAAPRRYVPDVGRAEVALQGVGLALVIAVAAAALRRADTAPLYLCLLPVVWIALRHGLHGSVAAVLTVNLGTALALPDASVEVVHFQVVLALTGLFLGLAITLRERAEARLRESGEMFRTLAESMSAATFIYQGTRFRYVNPAATELTGYSREELLSLDFWDVAHAEHRAMIRARGEARLRGEAVEPRYEFRIVHRSGEARWVDFTAGSILYHGEPAALGTAFDITARKRAEQALQEHARGVALLQHVATTANELHGVEEVLEACLQQLCDYGGWAVGHMHEVDAQGVLQPAKTWYVCDAERFARFRSRSETLCFANGQGLPGRALAMRTTVCIEDLAHDPEFVRAEEARESGLRGAVGIPIRVRGDICAVLEFFAEAPGCPGDAVVEVMENVATQVGRVFERERAERQLRQSEEHFRTIIERVSDVVHVSDPAQVIRYVTPSAERMLGYPPREMVGQPDVGFVHPDDRERVRQVMQAYLARGGVTPPMEVRLRHRDGSWRTVEATSDVIVHERAGRMVVTTSHDITQRKQLEEQLRQSQKMEAVGRLAGGIAHDFNNLLTAIIGNADLLLGDLAGDDPAREDVEEIRRAADRAASLTQQLLAFGRRQVLQLQVVHLAEVVGNVDRMLRRVIGEDVELVTRAPAALGRVKVDPRQVEQVLINLVVNARDAMPEGGRILIEGDNVVLDEDYARAHAAVVPGRYVRLAVSDTGHGMDAETRSRVFEPFFTTKAQGKGTGLGLSTVYGIVKQSGGYIWVYSEVGRGTTFKIYLPLVDDAPPPAPREAPEPTQRRGSETILLVEDEAPVRTLARRALERAGYRVLDADGGERALELCRAHAEELDLLLTDVLMPGLNGREVHEATAALRPGLPVLYMSGYTDEFIVERGILSPGLPFLQKPFAPAELVRKVREVLDSAPPA